MALRQVLEEQIRRNHKNIAMYQEKVSSLPKGTIHVRKVNGKEYYYLKFRDSEGKRVDRYIKKIDLAIVKHELNTRKQIEQWIKEMEDDIKLAEKALGDIPKSK